MGLPKRVMLSYTKGELKRQGGAMKTIVSVLVLGLAMSAHAARLIAGPLEVETGGSFPAPC